MTTESKVKNYEDCLNQMKEDLNIAQTTGQEKTNYLQELQSKLESKNNEINECSSNLKKSTKRTRNS
ncbi:MAG: hypothetical protein AB1782_14860 [Cyanobacteriota bacterium]